MKARAMAAGAVLLIVILPGCKSSFSIDRHADGSATVEYARDPHRVFEEEQQRLSEEYHREQQRKANAQMFAYEQLIANLPLYWVSLSTGNEFTVRVQDGTIHLSRLFSPDLASLGIGIECSYAAQGGASTFGAPYLGSCTARVPAPCAESNTMCTVVLEETVTSLSADRIEVECKNWWAQDLDCSTCAHGRPPEPDTCVLVPR